MYASTSDLLESSIDPFFSKGSGCICDGFACRRPYHAAAASRVRLRKPLAIVSAAKVLERANRHDARRIDLVLRNVIVALDMVEVHGAGDAFDLIEIAQITPQIGIIDDAPDIALEMPVIHRIEAD